MKKIKKVVFKQTPMADRELTNGEKLVNMELNPPYLTEATILKRDTALILDNIDVIKSTILNIVKDKSSSNRIKILQEAYENIYNAFIQINEQIDILYKDYYDIEISNIS